MAKKQKDETTNVNTTANRDIVQRLNFLYQASVYLQSITTSGPSSKGKEPQNDSTDAAGTEDMKVSETLSLASNKSIRKTARRKVKTKKTTGDLARSYVQCMRTVGQKTTVKIDPSLKRSLCSGCSSALIPGSSASIRLKKSRSQGHIMTYTCLHCGATKRIPAPPNSSAIVGERQQDTNAPSAHDPNHATPILEGPSGNLNKTRLSCSRPLPLFARTDAGHVIFRGNERLPQDQNVGFGVYFS